MRTPPNALAILLAAAAVVASIITAEFDTGAEPTNEGMYDRRSHAQAGPDRSPLPESLDPEPRTELTGVAGDVPIGPSERLDAGILLGSGRALRIESKGPRRSTEPFQGETSHATY